MGRKKQGEFTKQEDKRGHRAEEEWGGSSQRVEACQPCGICTHHITCSRLVCGPWFFHPLCIIFSRELAVPLSAPRVECIPSLITFGFSHMTSFGQWNGQSIHSEPLHTSMGSLVPLSTPFEDMIQLPHRPKEDKKFTEQSQTWPATSGGPG